MSPSSAFELMHEPYFPVLRVSNHLVVPKEQFIQWVAEQLSELNHRGLLDQQMVPVFKNTGKNFFSLPNKLFFLNIGHGAITVYVYLLYCEDRCTHQCHSSYRTIAAAVHLMVLYLSAWYSRHFLIQCITKKYFSDTIHMAGRLVPAGLYFVTEFLTVFLIPRHSTPRFQSALADPVLWLQRSSTHPH